MTPGLVDSALVKAPPLLGGEKLVVGVLTCQGRPVYETWRLAWKNLKFPIRGGSLVKRSHGKNKFAEICQARNRISERAVEVGAEYLFFLDDDVVPPTDALVRLLGVLKQDPRARVAGGVYRRRNQRGREEPLVWDSVGETMWLEARQEKPFRCGGVAGGAMLIDLRVLPALAKPWFRTELPTRDGTPLVSDDVIFCREVRRAGYEVYAHPGVSCQHLEQS